MADTVIFLYTNDAGGQLYFRRAGDCIMSDIDGVSSVDTKISESQGVGQTGATATAASVQPKTLTASGAVRSPAARAALLATVLPGVSARITMINGDARYYLEGSPDKTPIVANNRGVQKFQFSFRCSYPYWRGEEASTGLSGLEALFSFPRSLGGSWYISQYTTSAFAAVTNPGNMPSALTVRFYARAPVTDPQLYHLESDSAVQLNTTLDTGETIEVCTEYGRKGATLIRADGTRENVFRLLDISSNLNMQILPGDNTYRYDAADGKAGLDVTIVAPKGVWAGV